MTLLTVALAGYAALFAGVAVPFTVGAYRDMRTRELKLDGTDYLIMALCLVFPMVLLLALALPALAGRADTREILHTMYVRPFVGAARLGRAVIRDLLLLEQEKYV